MSLLPEINQASAEINKLVAQANIHQTIAPVDPAAFTDPADTMLLASRDPVIREVSVGMTGVEAVENTVSGTPPLTLTNSLGKPLKAWSVDVLPKQDLHGQDSPWPAGGGKNLLDKNAVSSGSYTPDSGAFNNYGIHSDYIKVTPGQQISQNKVKATTVTEGEQTFFSSWTYWDSNKQFVSGEWNASNTVTIPDDVAYLIVSTSRSIGNSSGQFAQSVVDEFLADYIIAEGGTVPTYEPYSNICPISGTDKLNLFVEESYDPTATPKAVLTLPQTVYTGTIGSDGGDSKGVEIDLGDLYWTYLSVYGIYQANLPVGIRVKTSWNDGYNNYMCSRYKQTANPQGYWNSMENNAYILAMYGVSSAKRIYVRDDEYSGDVAEFTTAVTGAQLVCELTDPVQFPITAPSIPTPTGTATTWATAEDGTVESMEVTYIKSE